MRVGNSQPIKIRRTTEALEALMPPTYYRLTIPRCLPPKDLCFSLGVVPCSRIPQSQCLRNFTPIEVGLQPSMGFKVLNSNTKSNDHLSRSSSPLHRGSLCRIRLCNPPRHRLPPRLRGRLWATAGVSRGRLWADCRRQSRSIVGRLPASVEVAVPLSRIALPFNITSRVVQLKQTVPTHCWRRGSLRAQM